MSAPHLLALFKKKQLSMFQLNPLLALMSFQKQEFCSYLSKSERFLSFESPFQTLKHQEVNKVRDCKNKAYESNGLIQVF